MLVAVLEVDPPVVLVDSVDEVVVEMPVVDPLLEIVEVVAELDGVLDVATAEEDVIPVDVELVALPDDVVEDDPLPVEDVVVVVVCPLDLSVSQLLVVVVCPLDLSVSQLVVVVVALADVVACELVVWTLDVVVVAEDVLRCVDDATVELELLVELLTRPVVVDPTDVVV